MGKKPRGPPVLTLSASADSSSPGQRSAKLIPPAPKAVTIDDVPEFQEQTRQNALASQAQLYLQVAMVVTLVYRWFKGRNKPKPKKPRTPPTNGRS